MARTPPDPARPAPVALVTGAARRVGRATALALADAGCDLLITWNTSENEANTLAEDVRERGRAATSFHADLANPGGIDNLIGAISGVTPHLDILVHNASRYRPAPPGSFDPEDAFAHFQVNAVAPLHLTTGLLPLLRKSALDAGAAVVAMLDIHALGSGSRPRKGTFTPYAMSKAALTEMVRALAVELAPDIRVNGVAPGVVAFPEAGYESDAEMQQRYLSRVPLGRSGTPEEAAEAVRWLALEGTYCTGEIIKVDGGRELR